MPEFKPFTEEELELIAFGWFHCHDFSYAPRFADITAVPVDRAKPLQGVWIRNESQILSQMTNGQAITYLVVGTMLKTLTATDDEVQRLMKAALARVAHKEVL